MSPADDVRMRGFRTRHTVKEALQWVDDHTSQLNSSETVPLENGFGRIVAEDIVSPIDVPRFDRAAMDGYAVLAEDTVGASPSSPVILKVTGAVLPGQPSDVELASGEAVRIMTGGPVPSGATAVVPVEVTRASALDTDAIDVVEAVAERKHIGRTGEDIESGSVICPAGTRLLPQHLGLLASVGLTHIESVCRPRVRIVTTGREVVPAGVELDPHQIYDANTPMLQALVSRDGGRVEAALRIGDDSSEIESALTGAGADVILVSGGSSVGAEDFAPLIVAEKGELPIHGVAMRPSSPAGMGRIAETLVFLLPGNPVSCLCAYDFFAGRGIRLMAGRGARWPYSEVTAVVSKRIVSAIGRTDYCRVRLTAEGVEPLAVSGASIMSSTTRADGFVVVPARLEGYPTGARVTVWCYDVPSAGHSSDVGV